MAKYGKNAWTVQFPDGMVKEINIMMNQEGKWINTQDFVRDAVREKIDRWKKEHGGYGNPERVGKKREG